MCKTQVNSKNDTFTREGERNLAFLLTFLQHCHLTDSELGIKDNINMTATGIRELFLRELLVITVVQELTIPVPLSLGYLWEEGKGSRQEEENIISFCQSQKL